MEQPFPEDDFQDSPPAEHESQERRPKNAAPKYPDDFVIPFNFGDFLVAGKMVKQLTETEMKKMNTWLSAEMAKVPPVNGVTKLFEIQNQIKAFLRSVGAE